MTRERIDLTAGDESAVYGATRKASPSRTINLINNNQKDPELAIDADIDQDDALQKEDARFLRAEKRVPVRRGPLPRKAAGRLKGAGTLVAALVLAGGLMAAAYHYGAHAGLFSITSSDSIEISGVRNASRAEVLDAFGEDIERSVFFVPLDQRRTKIETLTWVESATVMRLLPDRIAVNVVERKPVAFVQVGNRIQLIDAAGVILGTPPSRQAKYSFPVIRGIAETESLSARAAGMKIYGRLVRDLDSGKYMQQLSEVDLSDPEDVKATVNDAGGTVLVHLGSADFLGRYKLFAEHIGEWRQQFSKVQSVDMRYEGQIVVNPETEKSSDRVKKTGDPSTATKPNAPERPVARTTPSVKQSRKPQKKMARQDSKAKGQKAKPKS
jgi:cell division protein FtsQ